MRFKANFETRNVGDDTLVVLSEQAGGNVEKILKLNKTASEILDMVHSGMSEQETAEAMAKKYTIGWEKAASDVQKVLTQLAKQGILEL